MKGLVTKSTGSWYQVMEESSGEFFEARIRGKFKLQKIRLTNPLAVGDRVEFQIGEDGVAWITKIEPRENYLIRKSVNLSKEFHIIAANLDIACFLFTLKNPETSTGFLDRFLVCCEAYSIPPLILFNKWDLLDEQDIPLAESLMEVYQNIGYEAISLSSVSNLNLESIKAKIQDKTSVFFGHSGSGKSTLVNSLQPGLNLKTGEVSAAHLKGRHTTTFAQMHFWDFGGAVIDTPGVREFALTEVEPDEVQHYFPEILSAAEGCKYYNCMHISEPQCAVAAKVEAGEIAEFRFADYLKLLAEAQEAQIK